MRIAIDCRYIRERPSGIGAYVQELVDRLPLIAPEDSFALWAHQAARRPLSDLPNTSEITVAAEPNSLWTILWPQCYASLDGIELFHGAHNILPRNIQCPTVVTIHDVLAIDHPALLFTRWSQRIKRLYYPQAIWRALRKATRLIVTTARMAERVIELHPASRQRVVVVPMGVSSIFSPPATSDAASRRAREITGFDAPYFLVVGQDTPSKRHGFALAAFARDAPKPWRLVFVQRQSRRAVLDPLAQSLGVADRVSWFPDVASADLITLYQAAGALLQPSMAEGFGLPVVEAMACGCPVIASDIPTLREVIGDAGVLVPVNDGAAFGRALTSLAKSSEQRRHLAGTGLRRVAVFSWDRCARATLQVYRDAASA